MIFLELYGIVSFMEFREYQPSIHPVTFKVAKITPVSIGIVHAATLGAAEAWRLLLPGQEATIRIAFHDTLPPELELPKDTLGYYDNGSGTSDNHMGLSMSQISLLPPQKWKITVAGVAGHEATHQAQYARGEKPFLLNDEQDVLSDPHEMEANAVSEMVVQGLSTVLARR